MALSVEHSAPNRRARVLGSPGETPPWTLMVPSACEIRRAYNFLEVLIQNYASGAGVAPVFARRGGMMSPTGGPIKFLHFMHTYNLHFMHNYNLCTFYEYLYLHR